jgi:hypothetical protein
MSSTPRACCCGDWLRKRASTSTVQAPRKKRLHTEGLATVYTVNAWLGRGSAIMEWMSRSADASVAVVVAGVKVI